MTNAEALRPRKPEGSLGRTAQDGHLDSHTAPELWGHSYVGWPFIGTSSQNFIYFQNVCNLPFHKLQAKMRMLQLLILLPVKSREQKIRFARDVGDTFATYPGLVYGVTDHVIYNRLLATKRQFALTVVLFATSKHQVFNKDDEISSEKFC